MIRVKGFGLSRGFMSEGYVEIDHEAERIRVTVVAGESSAQLLELLDNDSNVVAAYAPGRWVSAHVVEGATEIEHPARTVYFEKEASS